MGVRFAGGLLDYDAVLKELDGKIGALGLDVQWSEPFDPDDPVAKHPRQAFLALQEVLLQNEIRNSSEHLSISCC